MVTEKSEITNLPEGMSSEELDKMTTEGETDDDLAQEALDATGSEEESSPAGESVAEDEPKTEEEETPAKKETEVDPKDAVIGDFRRKLRDKEIESARLQGELEARKDLQTKAEPVPKSPLEIAEAAYIEENGDLDGFAMTGKLYREQKAFDDEQVATKAANENKVQAESDVNQTVNDLQGGDLSVEKAGPGLDFESVMSKGQHLLTKGDLSNIAETSRARGKDTALREAYETVKRRMLAAGGEDARALKAAIDTKKGKKSQTKPKKQGKTDIDALTTEGEDEVEGEAETETHSQRLTNWVTRP